MPSIIKLSLLAGCLCCFDGSLPALEKETNVQKLFVCQIYSERPGVKVIESADMYAATRKAMMEITWPEPGVRRAEARILRALENIDFARNRVVLIWNASMADHIQLVAADAEEIRVKNVPTGNNALAGSAQLLVLLVPRAKTPPHIRWEGPPAQPREGLKPSRKG